MTRVSVVGAGSWGTAFAAIPAEKGVKTVIWARRPELAEAITERHRNADYLADLELPPALRATSDVEEAVTGAGVVVMAVPSHAYREVFRTVLPFLAPGVPVVSLTKGIEQDTLQRMTAVMGEEADLDPGRLAVVSGPNLAKEVVLRMPSATVVACADDEQGARLQELFMAPHFRVYRNEDVTGVELGGALKNVIALAAGIADGMGFGDNTRASLITRGLAEMTRLGVKLGGNPLTFAGLAGMGDLVATCISKLSRNRTVGEKLGRGQRLDDIVGEMRMVAEGVKTSRPVLTIAEREGVEMPIAEHVVKVLYEGVPVEDMVRSLMGRAAKPELHGIDR
ncbi:MAG TPA: NAD(P)H-dependent glycerol-3-phosphate dehydrogenase [Actinomycetota bacterium]|nr:NAD(P)H-dependent glycerol-3-phosphate dehydrogenase [Actinomycetota bacterium]